MEKKVSIKIEIDPACKEPQVIIRTDEETALTESLVNAIERCVAGEYPRVTANNGDEKVFIDQWAISRIYTENRRLTICTEDGTYESKLSLKELEDILDADNFVRISRFEIVNLRKVVAFDLSIAGTIRVAFEDGAETWVARRYVRAIQEKLREKRGGDQK